MNNEFSIIGFYVILMILLNIFSIGYGDVFLKNADFLDEDTKKDYSGDIWGTLNFLLFVQVPESSKFLNTLIIYRLIYWLIVLPYTILISYIIVRLIRGI